MSFELQPLPYSKSALEPHISERTVSFHYDKHHAGYVKKLNDAVKDSPLAQQSLEDIITGKPAQGTYNSAAQVWNHDLYWRSLTPDTTRPSADLSELIDNAFKSKREFEEKLKTAALGEFGSGWAWVLFDPDSSELKIETTTDAVCPLGSGKTPLLTVDVWEHAYYLDYQNDRGDYLEHLISNLLDWESASKRLHAVMAAA